MQLELLPLFGILAGMLTTLTGQGGGLFLLLSLVPFVGVRDALCITTPALLIGNAHRAWLCRKSIDWRIAKRTAMGAVPGAICGGLLAGKVPEWVISVVMVVMTGFAILKAIGKLKIVVPARAIAPAGAAIGTLTGAAGGAGVLLSPLFLSLGLSGRRYVGTISTVAVMMHTSRLVAYGAGGLFHGGTGSLLLAIVLVTPAISVGNAIADHARKAAERRFGVARLAPWVSRLEHATLFVCTLLAVTGMTR